MGEDFTKVIARLSETVVLVESEIQRLTKLMPKLQEEDNREKAMSMIEKLCAQAVALRGQVSALKSNEEPPREIDPQRLGT